MSQSFRNVFPAMAVIVLALLSIALIPTVDPATFVPLDTDDKCRILLNQVASDKDVREYDRICGAPAGYSYIDAPIRRVP